MKKWNKLSKAARIGILLPTSLLGAGGLAFGGIAIAGYVFNVGPLAEITKIDINTIFGVENATKYMNDSSNRKNYYTPDDVYDGMIAYLNDLAKAYASGANADVMNDINVAKLNGVTVGEQILSAAVSVKPNSQKYSGNNFDLYVYNDKAFTRTLSNDFTNHDFNCVTNNSLSSFANSVNLTFGNILGSTGILKLLNSSLSLNDVVVQYYDNDGGWKDIPNNGNILGPETSLTTLVWSITNDNYGGTSKLQLAPKQNGVYNGQNSIPFTVELYRPELSSQTGWPTTDSNMFKSFVVAPSIEQLATTFREKYGDFANTQKTIWWDRSFAYIGGTSGYENWVFVKNQNKAGLNFKGTPYFASQSSATTSTSPENYSWEYDFTQPVALNTEITITTLNFNVDPTFNDVKIYIAAASQSVSHWGELTITITSSSKTITIMPVSGSIHYTQASVTINYTLPT